MPIKPEHLDELLAGYEKPEDLLGDGGRSSSSRRRRRAGGPRKGPGASGGATVSFLGRGHRYPPLVSRSNTLISASRVASRIVTSSKYAIIRDQSSTVIAKGAILA